MKDKLSKPYRPCIVGVFINHQKQVLVALRRDKQTWQFPQGGVENGESFEEALFREMQEEIGCNRFRILKAPQDILSYDFPPGATFEIAKFFSGQSQRWFLCQFEEGFGPNLADSTCDEFSDIRWVSPQHISDTIIDWKKDIYGKGLRLLGLL